MKKSLLDKTKIDLDLTSLLDVVFILLMFVMCYQVMNVSQKNQEADELITEYQANTAASAKTLEDLEAQSEMLSDLIEKYDTIEDRVKIVTVYCDYDPANIRSRYIRWGTAKEGMKTIEVTPENADEAFERFNRDITAYISENPSVPVLVSVNKDKILYRDAIRMDELISSMDSSNCYFTEGEAE